jgi:hypothetical protein
MAFIAYPWWIDNTERWILLCSYVGSIWSDIGGGIMEWLSKINPWVLLASVGMICTTIFGIIVVVIGYLKGFKTVKIGNAIVEKGSTAVVRHTSLKDEELERMAKKVGKIVIDALGHTCVQAENIAQLMAGQRPVLAMVTALAADAAKRGINGSVAAAQGGLEKYREEHEKWADAKLAGVGP